MTATQGRELLRPRVFAAEARSPSHGSGSDSRRRGCVSIPSPRAMARLAPAPLPLHLCPVVPVRFRMSSPSNTHLIRPRPFTSRPRLPTMNVIRTSLPALVSRLTVMRAYSTAKPDLSNSHVVGGFKATLNNPNASDEAKVGTLPLWS